MTKKHVPDLELCQEFDRLCKEKNITIPETEFYWCFYNVGGWILHHVNQSYDKNVTERIPAPLVSEQGEWLWNIFEEHNWDLLYKAYGEVFNFKGTQRIGELGIINLMKRPNMGIKMLNYLIAEGIITKL